MEELNNFVTDGAIASAVAFSMQADIPSGPLAFDVSYDLRKAHISSSVHASVYCYSQEVQSDRAVYGKKKTGAVREL